MKKKDVKPVNEKKFIEMIERNSNYIRAVCANLARHGSLQAEDLVQETVSALWVKHCRNGGSLIRDGSSVSTLIYAIARNCHLKLSRRRPPIEYQDADTLPEVAQEEPDNGRLDRLLELCDDLSEGERSLMLSCIEGYSVSEIAEQLSISEGAVRNRISRTIKKIKKMNNPIV